MFLRLLCLLAGVLILVAPPAMLFPAGATGLDALRVAVLLIGLVLASSGFFLVGMAGHRMRRSWQLRALAALLLAPPVGASVLVMWRGGSPTMLWMCSLMLSFTLVLYLTVVCPVVSTDGPRRLRKREPRLEPGSPRRAAGYPTGRRSG